MVFKLIARDHAFPCEYWSLWWSYQLHKLLFKRSCFPHKFFYLGAFGAFGCVEWGDCFFYRKLLFGFLGPSSFTTSIKSKQTTWHFSPQSLHCANNTNRALLYTLYNLRAFNWLSLYRIYALFVAKINIVLNLGARGLGESLLCHFKSAWSLCPSLSVYDCQKSFLCPMVAPLTPYPPFIFEKEQN